MCSRWAASLLGGMAIACLLVVGGCGSGDGSDSSSSTSTATVTIEVSSISKAEFIKKAGAICSTGIAKVGEVVNEALQNESSVRPVEDAVLPVAEGWVDEISALGAPKGEKGKIEAFLSALQADLERAKLKPSASLDQFAADFKKSGDLARNYKIEACALG